MLFGWVNIGQPAQWMLSGGETAPAVGSCEKVDASFVVVVVFATCSFCVCVVIGDSFS